MVVSTMDFQVGKHYAGSDVHQPKHWQNKRVRCCQTNKRARQIACSCPLTAAGTATARLAGCRRVYNRRLRPACCRLPTLIIAKRFCI